MKLRIIVGPDGKVRVEVSEGTFAEASEKVDNLLNLLRANGIEFAEMGQPEQHRHDDQLTTTEHTHVTE